MTNVIELAKQAGFDTINDKVYVWAGQSYISVELERFATLVREAYRAELLKGRKGPVCRLWVEPETCNYIVDRCDHHPSETIDVYTADQLAAAVLRARRDALEKCLEIAGQCADADMHASMVANAIRQLKDNTP